MNCILFIVSFFTLVFFSSRFINSKEVYIFFYKFFTANVTQNNTEDSPGKGDLYFVGAIIALSSAILSAANNIVVAKIVRTGCSIWIATKVNKYCGHVFRVRHFSLQIYAGPGTYHAGNMCTF